MAIHLEAKRKYEEQKLGDIESLPFIEAIRQLNWELPKNVLFIHLTLIPYLSK